MTEGNRQPAKRAGLIVNPRSGKGAGKGLALARQLEGEARVSLGVIERFGEIARLLDRMAADGVTELFISSGDGTIQEILTQLAERRPFPVLPRIGLLPHGTTNLSANDLGFRAHAIAAQAAFLRSPAPRDLQQRHTIRCANPGDGRVRHGMFVGSGAVALATRYCQEAFNERGIRGQRAVAKTLFTGLRKHFFSAFDPADESRFDKPHSIAVEANGRRWCEGPQLLQMSTTLDRLALGTRPFWGGKTAPIRTTLFPYPVPSVMRWLLPVMYGGETRKAPPGAVSFCSERLSITADTYFVIDGEFFPAPANEPLRLETGPLFTFVKG